MSDGTIEWITVPSPLPTGPLTVGVTGLGVAAVHFTPESVPEAGRAAPSRGRWRR